jgi:hypothetical protein
MSGSFYGEELCFCGNHLHRVLEFFDGSEGITGALHEQRWRAQVGEMLRALLLGFARWVQWIGEKQ